MILLSSTYTHFVDKMHAITPFGQQIQFGLILGLPHMSVAATLVQNKWLANESCWKIRTTFKTFKSVTRDEVTMASVFTSLFKTPLMLALSAQNSKISFVSTSVFVNSKFGMSRTRCNRLMGQCHAVCCLRID